MVATSRVLSQSLRLSIASRAECPIELLPISRSLFISGRLFLAPTYKLHMPDSNRGVGEVLKYIVSISFSTPARQRDYISSGFSTSYPSCRSLLYDQLTLAYEMSATLARSNPRVLFWQYVGCVNWRRNVTSP